MPQLSNYGRCSTRWKVSKPIRLTLFLLEALLALLLVALIIMTTGWFQRVLERQVIAGLESVTGGRVEIVQFDFNPWLFRIRLRQLVIHGLEPASAPPLFMVDEAETGLSPRQLFRRRVHLRYLDIDHLQIHLRTNSHGIINLPGPPDWPIAEAMLKHFVELSIGRLTISHSTFYWNDQQQPLEAHADDLAMLLRSRRGRYSGTLASSAISIRSSRWPALPPLTVHGRFELSPASLILSPIAWEAPATNGEASITIALRPDAPTTGSFHAAADVPLIAKVLHRPELRGGDVQMEGVGLYEQGHISAQGRAQARKLLLFSPSFGALRLDATTSYAVDNRQISFTNLESSIWGGTVVGTAQANFQTSPPTFHLNSHLHRMRAEKILQLRGAPPLLSAALHPVSEADGILNASWRGPGKNVKAAFELSLQAPGEIPPQALPVSGLARGTLEVQNGFTLQLADSQFHTPHSTITAHGMLAQWAGSERAGSALALTIATDEFSEWRPLVQALVETSAAIPLQLKSQAQFSGNLSGSVEQPFVTGRVRMGEVQYRDWTWDRAAASIALSPSLIQVSDGRVEHANSSFDLTASAQLENWRLTPASLVHVTAHAQQTPIEGLKAAVNLDLPVRGSVSGHIDVEGTATTMAGSGVVRVEPGAVADEPFDSLVAQLHVARSVWAVQDFLLRKKQGHIVGNLIIEPKRHFISGQLQGADLHLADFHRLPVALSAAVEKQELDGNLSFEVSGQGRPGDLRLQCNWHLLRVSVGGTRVGEFHGIVNGMGNQLMVVGDGQTAEGGMHFTAQTTADGAWPLSASGEYTGLRADPWIHALMHREFGAIITLNGSFHAQGSMLSPEKIAFDSVTRDVAIDFPTIKWRNAQPVITHYSHGVLEFDRFMVRGPYTELSVQGSVDFAKGMALELSADGSANAGVLTLFDPHLDAGGRSNLRLRLTGTPDLPLLNGAIDIQRMSLGYRQLPFRFNDLEGTINLEGERAVIEHLRGTSGGGTANLSGFVTLSASPRFEVQAELGHVRMRYPSSFTSVLDGNLRLVGDAEQARLQGELVVRQMALSENVNIISKIIESSNPLLEQTPAIDSPLASKIRLNVRVSSAPPVQLQTANLRVVGDIDLHLQGTLANPVQVGAIHLLSGESVFRGNRYTLARGDINMSNPFRTQAYLDMEVQTHVQSYELTLDISGPFDRLKFSYRSDPPLANTDIVSLLALGYVPQEGAFSTVSGNPAASVGASAILSEALSSQKTSRIQHLFGVSRIKIDPNVGVPGFGSGALVTVEQQVTHDLTLTYVTDTSYSQYRIIQFEWNVNNNVSVLGIRDQNGVFGVEFRFKRRFK